MANGTATQYVSPPFPFVRIHPCIHLCTFILQRNYGTRTRTRTNERMNESTTTNTRVEEWLIENLYHPVWYSFISYTLLSIRITYVHNFARKHGQTFFSLPLSLSHLDTREERLKTFLDWISDRAEVRFSEERVPSSVINILTVVRGKAMLLFLAMTGMKL